MAIQQSSNAHHRPTKESLVGTKKTPDIYRRRQIAAGLGLAAAVGLGILVPRAVHAYEQDQSESNLSGKQTVLNGQMLIRKGAHVRTDASIPASGEDTNYAATDIFHGKDAAVVDGAVVISGPANVESSATDWVAFIPTKADGTPGEATDTLYVAADNLQYQYDNGGRSFVVLPKDADGVTATREVDITFSDGRLVANDPTTHRQIPGFGYEASTN